MEIGDDGMLDRRQFGKRLAGLIGAAAVGAGALAVASTPQDASAHNTPTVDHEELEVRLAPLDAAAEDAYDAAQALRGTPELTLAEAIEIIGTQAIYAEAFGVTADNSTDDSTALQAALNESYSHGATLILPHNRQIYLATGVTLPNSIVSTPHIPLEIEGNGATLRTDQAITILGDTVPADLTALVNRTQRQIMIRNLRLRGNSQSAQVGLRVYGSYGMHLQNVRAVELGTGYDLIFCLMALIESCFSHANTTYGYRLRSANGLVTGAGVVNSAPNSTRFLACRDYGKAGMTAQFDIRACSGVVLDGCITEGENPVNGVVYDFESSTTANIFTIRDHHHENTPSGAAIKVKTNYRAIIDNFLTGMTNIVMIDSSECGSAALIVVRDLPVWPTGSKMRHGTTAYGHAWQFERPGSQGTFDVQAAGAWHNGVVPGYLRNLRFSAAPDNLGGTYPVDDGANTYMIRAGNRIILGISGTVDPNPRIWAGAPLSTFVHSVSPNGATLAASSAVAYLDEAADQIKWLVKESGGGTGVASLPYGLGSLRAENSLVIGSGGTAITKHLSAAATWDPPSVNTGAFTSTTVSVTGAAVGDTVAVGFSQALTPGMILSGYVSAANTVTVVLLNMSGGAIDLASGTLRADVWKH